MKSESGYRNHIMKLRKTRTMKYELGMVLNIWITVYIKTRFGVFGRIWNYYFIIIYYYFIFLFF